MASNKSKLLTGTILSLLLGGVAVYPAIANQAEQGNSNQNFSQMSDQMSETGAMRGRVTGIVGSLITIKMDNGESQTINISREQRADFIPGTAVLIRDGEIVDFGPSAAAFSSQDSMQNYYSYAEPMRARITSITGTLATVEMENGQTQTVGISRLQRSELVPGTEVMVRNGRILEVASPSMQNEMQNR
ncbi:MAG TPA: hypothetical protein DDZ80_24240 [Cyanobacteria bacterium UBA8803]|nr:hypothetical protein [Cyanobacteria bacterium UBA9273]HBL61423.1 hypothetical protein [Cyanobacteria bacterium UBA8803]